MLGKFRSHLLPILLLGFITLGLTRYLWSTRSIIETHDGIFHVIRLTEMTEMIKLGHFPVRWAGQLDNGFGLPLFNYVYPGPYYLGLPLTLLGVSAKWVVKLTFMSLYLLGGLGVYALFAKNKRRAVLLSILYLVTPYLLLNLFVRGALGEFMAISLIPWVALSLRHLSQTRQLRWYHPLPYALLFLSHNFLSFLFLPIYLAYAVTKKALRPALASLGLSLGLAAFFILPMLAERGYLLSVQQSDFTYTYQDHFLFPSQMLYSPWGGGYSIVGAGDDLSFQLGIPHLTVLVLALSMLIKKRASTELKFWLVMIAGVIFFTTPLSQPVWQLLSPLQIVQFPWRFLALFVALIPLLAGAVLAKSSSHLSSFLIYLSLVVGLTMAWIYSTPSYLQNPDQFTTQMYIHRDKTTTSSRRELLPRWSVGEERWKGDEEVRILGGSADFVITDPTPISLELISRTDDPATNYLIRRHYFPLWQVTDEQGREISLKPDANGEIIFTPDLGEHTYTLRLRSTPIERTANLMTILSLATIIVLAYVQNRTTKAQKRSR